MGQVFYCSFAQRLACVNIYLGLLHLYICLLEDKHDQLLSRPILVCMMDISDQKIIFILQKKSQMLEFPVVSWVSSRKS